MYIESKLTVANIMRESISRMQMLFASKSANSIKYLLLPEIIWARAKKKNSRNSYRFTWYFDDIYAHSLVEHDSK